MSFYSFRKHAGICLAIGFSAILVIAGCEEPASEVGVFESEPPPGEANSDPSIWDSLFGASEETPEASRPVELLLHFDVMRVELPIDDVRHSQKIWNHVDEMQIPPSHAKILAANGFRVGVAERDAWPAIRTLLNAHHATSNRSQQAVQSGHPLTLDIGNVSDGERIFLYTRNGSLTSRTFDAGKQYIHVEYVTDPDNLLRCQLTVIPEVFCLGRSRVWTGTEGNYKEEVQYKGRRYKELSATVTLEEGQFLVIGSTGDAESSGNRFLLGGRFFERYDAGRRYEVLLFITPEAFRNE